MTPEHRLAADAFEACGASLTREEFSVFAWCCPLLEQRAWVIYAAIRKQ